VLGSKRVTAQFGSTSGFCKGKDELDQDSERDGITMRNPTIIYFSKGIPYACYAIWSIRSLLKFNYEPIEMIVCNERERNFFISHCPGVVCSIVDADTQGYPNMSYKAFVLTKYLQEVGIQHKGRDVVVCDADILWKQDPAPLFRRFNGQNWVHKITAVNPQDYDLDLKDIPASNIGLITTYHYRKRYGISRYPNFRLNGGLFMLEESAFADVIEDLLEKIYALPTDEMLMADAILTLTYTEMGLIPVCDKEDIKHLGVEKGATDLSIFSFEIAQRDNQTQFTGYQTAKHYYGDQRRQMIFDARKMGLDEGNLARYTVVHLARKNLRKIPKIPSKAMERIRRNLAK
jgi:hypothetical protein